MKLTLTAMKRNPALRERFAGKVVLIWSGEWRQWWRPTACGYTSDVDKAGLYSFEDAWRRSFHYGPENKIAYHAVKTRDEIRRKKVIV